MAMNKTIFPHGVLILGAETQGLGILRSLARMKVPSLVVDEDRYGVAMVSRYCRKFLQSPPYNDNHAFAEFLIAICQKHNLYDWTLFPTDDEQVRVLSEYKSELAPYYKNWIPEWPCVQTVYDKDKLYRFAQKLYLEIPCTTVFRSWDEVKKSALQYPVIIKPAVRETFSKTFKKKAIEVQSKKELQKQLEHVTKKVSIEKLLIQEVIPGTGAQQYSYAAFFKDGAPIVDLIACRARQHPMDYGKASTFVEVVDYQQVRKISIKLLKGLNYYGVCEVEFKEDPRDGGLKLLEINARSWGWHTLTKATGIDWPFFLFCDIYNYDYSHHAAPVKKKTQWLKMITDLPIALHECIAGRLPIGKLIAQYLSKNTEHASLCWHDPLPFIFEWLLIPYLWFKRGF